MTKKHLLFGTLFITSTLLSYELNFDKKFTHDIRTDVISSYVQFSTINKNERNANDAIEDINDFFKATDLVTLKNGNYNLTPKYTYKNNRTKFIGYSANISYEVQSKDAINFNSFLNELNTAKDDSKDESLKLHVGNVSWNISTQAKEIAMNNLRTQSILWIKKYIMDSGSTCAIKNINMSNNIKNSQYYPRTLEVMSSKKISNISPQSSHKKISLTVNYILECR